MPVGLGGTAPASLHHAAVILISLVLGGAYLYRISAEERMLRAELGAPYQMYQQRTWRLIPGLF